MLSAMLYPLKSVVRVMVVLLVVAMSRSRQNMKGKGVLRYTSGVVSWSLAKILGG